MRILYLGCHSVLEWDDMSLFTEIDSTLPEKMGIEIFSLNGAYMNPLQQGDFMRSVIPHGVFYEDLYNVGLQCSKDLIHEELIKWADVILMTHNSAVPGQHAMQPWVVNNWNNIKAKNKSVIWRSIGQSVPAIEKELKLYKAKGLRIVRYSPLEEFIPDYCGGDIVIRFYKDPNEFTGWTGQQKHVITIAQSYLKRGDHLGFPLFDKITHGFERKVFGISNADLRSVWGGPRNYEELKIELKRARVFFYFGTVPAQYTLSLIEAMMTGVPIVAVGKGLRAHPAYRWDNYEVPNIIENGVNGYVSDNVDELRGYIELLLNDEDTARRIGQAGRTTAIRLFDKRLIMEQWANYLKTLFPR